MKITRLLLLAPLLFTQHSWGSGFYSKLELESRFDARHEKDPRYQYKVRWQPKYQFDTSAWSLHGFVSTGDEFASSYNTINAQHTQHLYLRRFFARYESQYGKSEFGVIPTYKGKVASTGLSKDGWITGARQVYSPTNDIKLEFVVGELAHLDSPTIRSPHSLDYVELEVSVDFSEQWSYELGVDHMLDDNFIRGEIRYHPENSETEYAIELLNNLDTQHSKLVLSNSRNLLINNNEIELFAYYSYVNEAFGARAELTEDFVDFGHSFTLELESELISEWSLNWFSKLKFHQGQSRFQLGLKLTI